MQGRINDIITIHLEETTQIFTRIRTAIAICTQHDIIFLRQVRPNLLGKCAYIITGGNHRPFVPLKTLGNPWNPLGALRIQAVVACRIQPITL